jgi:hypothetical protein
MSTAAQTKETTQTAQSKPGYDVARPAGKCHVSGKTIEVGEKFMTVLRENPLGFERLDISLDCWSGFDRSNILAHWQATMPQAELKRKLLVDDAILCELFERLGTAEEPAKINFRFVLGLILMRKRLVVYETTRVEDGKEIWTMRPKGREDRLDLINPRLDEQQVAEVSQQLGQILNEEI